jgi:putative ABC transport system permease protein
MRRTELFRFAAGAIIAHPMRSALTTLGVVIGVAAVVTMTSIGLGASKQVESSISSLGSNLITVQPGSNRAPGGFVNQGAGANVSMTSKDTDAIKAQVTGIAAISSGVRGQSQVASEGGNWNTQVWGVDADYLTVRDMTVAQGRMFTQDDADSGRKVLVIGQTVATNLFQDNNPIGQRIRVGRVPFEVIGLLTPKGQSAMGQDQDDLVIGPLKAIRSRVLGRRFRGDSIQNIFVKAADKDDLDRVQEDVTNVMRDVHKIGPGEDDDFQIQNMASMMEAMQSTTNTFTFLLAAVAGVSLLVGGVGIMNIMLVAVTERTREIGLRMALGATRNDILAQFALEAVTLSLFGGLLGLLIGIGGAFIVSGAFGWATNIPAWAGPLSLGFSMFVGLVFGAYPSWRAAQLDPIEALRRD